MQIGIYRTRYIDRIDVFCLSRITNMLHHLLRQLNCKTLGKIKTTMVIAIYWFWIKFPLRKTNHHHHHHHHHHHSVFTLKCPFTTWWHLLTRETQMVYSALGENRVCINGVLFWQREIKRRLTISLSAFVCGYAQHCFCWLLFNLYLTTVTVSKQEPNIRSLTVILRRNVLFSLVKIEKNGMNYTYTKNYFCMKGVVRGTK